MNKSPATDNPRVTVTLKALVDLAKPAGMLSLGHANIRAAQSGNYLSHLKGRGMAFDETRLYQPGDDVRRIDWRVTARTDKPHSKIFKEERERPMFCRGLPRHHGFCHARRVQIRAGCPFGRFAGLGGIEARRPDWWADFQ